ncbi:MAG: phosphatidate cytidylyltransferase [Nitrospirota bacterium]
MHLQRLIVALAVLPIFYLYIMKLPQIFFFILLLAVSVIAQLEFYSMYNIRGVMKKTGLLMGVAILLMTYYSPNSISNIILISFVLVTSVRLVSKRDPLSSLNDISPVMLSLLYIPSLLGLQISLRQNGPEWIIFLFGSVWASDSLAYYIGKGIGKRRLYMEVSPNKTVAGAFGSLLGGALSACLLDLLLVHRMGLSKAIFVGIIIGATTITGDLVESMFKRDAGVKDSSNIIPGHGGVLDKIDGVLFAGPALYWILVVLSNYR